MNPKATPKPQFLISLSFLVITLFLSIPFPTLAAEEYRFDRMWPTLQQPWYFKSPLGIAIDRNGYVYVAEIGQYRIQKFTADGILVHRWGKQGSGESEFNRPRAIAVDVNNVVYVVDSGNNRIQKFTSNGQFVSLWGSYGNGEEEFVSPGGIAIAPTGYIYIADTYNNRIQKFTTDGQLVTKWGNEGSGDGEFFWPEGIAVDKNGYVYVVDTLNYRIQKFTADGHFVGKWGSQGSGDGKFEFSYPSGIAVDDNEYVYVFDSGNQRIQKFTFDGQFVATWGTLGAGEGEFGYYGGAIAADNNGLLYVTDTGNYRIEKFTTESQFVAKWGSEGVKDGEFRSPLGITVDRSGTIYVADANNHRIQKFTSNGLFLGSWGSPGSGDGEFFVLWGIGVDKNGYLYVTDHHNNRVQKFTSDGQFVTKWGSEGWGHEGNAEGEFYWPEGIAVDGNGYVYVVDTYNHRIQKFTSDGQFVATWGREGSNDSEFYYPSGIAVDENGYVFVADTSNNRIQKFTSEGEFLNKWGVFGGGDGEFDGPSDLRIDQDGFLYVTDSYNHRIQKFTTDGQFVTKWGSLGSEPGNFNVPSALAIDSSGRFFVSESGNNRIQAFKKVIQTSNNKAIIVAGGGPYPGNNLWEATQMCANFAYRTLTFQGFTKESIYYLTSNTGLDLDSNGVSDDVDGDATTSNLQQAVTTWASGADDVILYLTDHGGNGTFRMSDTETLPAPQLDSWLDSIRQTISGKVIVIYDACESGSFLSSLRPPSGKERIIISSTSRGENAYFVTQGSISFSNYFWTHIFNGLTVANAFTLAEEAISQTTNYQNPLLDDNGNGIGNEASDGALAQSTYLGNGTIIYGEAPVIGTVSPPQTLSNSSTTLLFADGVIDADGIARVWAVIRPPNYMQSSPDNPVQEIPSLNLLSVGGERYEGAYEHFNIPGTYQIAIYARDRIGNTSVPQLTTVSVNNPLTRKAIIVAGGQATDPLWPAIENNATLAYDALTYQGYTDETINFMSPVTISSGVDTLPTLANLRFAITTWAKQNTQDLV
ncbi:MAG: 6-bladed beta-propeller, partial [Pseudomonadota bacterium]